MYNIVINKWPEILNYFKNEYDISDVSFNSWIKPLQVYSVDNGIVSLLFENSSMIDYINKKYHLPLMVSIQEITGEELDVEFISPGDLDKKATPDNQPSVAPSQPATPDTNILTNKKLEANLNPNYTFDSFVVGGNNNYAHAYALAVAESPAVMYNP